jgi:hypothetical protein
LATEPRVRPPGLGRRPRRPRRPSNYISGLPGKKNIHQ